MTARRRHLPRPTPRLDRPWPTLPEFTGKFCRGIRLALGIHHSKFCRDAGISPDTLIRWERGMVHPHDPDFPARVREALRAAVFTKVADFLATVPPCPEFDLRPRRVDRL